MAQAPAELAQPTQQGGATPAAAGAINIPALEVTTSKPQAKRGPGAAPVAAGPAVPSASADLTPQPPGGTAQSAPGSPAQPGGQTVTTIQHDRATNTRAFSVGDLLQESPGISIKQGNGPRDLGVSIRGSNARNGFAVRNVVVFEDGFPVTQPDGLSRTDLIDPHAYGGVDVWRGPSSALFGNYATGGAINFRSRTGREINGLEYGTDIGGFGYFNNYVALGNKLGAFEYSLFASDVRSNGHLDFNGFETQTINFLGTFTPTVDDRFTVKFIRNDLDTDLSIRLSLNQFNQNPFQKGCETAAAAAPGCGTVRVFANGFNGAQLPLTAGQASLGRNDHRTILGARWNTESDPTPNGRFSSSSTTATSTSQPEQRARSATFFPTMHRAIFRKDMLSSACRPFSCWASTTTPCQTTVTPSP